MKSITKSRAKREGKYEGKVGGRHVHEWFGWRVYSIGTPRNRKAKKVQRMAFKCGKINEDILF